ncbi:MAG: hypothetical protein D6725_07185 [Planctomycetota bacterium]|nr:MAG: hypothetical protein D6725_07185 [Planctomycetota bacterium]
MVALLSTLGRSGSVNPRDTARQSSARSAAAVGDAGDPLRAAAGDIPCTDVGNGDTRADRPIVSCRRGGRFANGGCGKVQWPIDGCGPGTIRSAATPLPCQRNPPMTLPAFVTGVLLAAGVIDLSEPLELRYSGSVAPVGRFSVQPATKQFTLHAVVERTERAPITVRYLLEERGSGGWAWPERFGEWLIGADGTTRGRAPTLLYSYNDNEYPISLPWLVFPFAEKLDDGAQWEHGDYVYEVLGRRRLEGDQTRVWLVQAVHRRGRHRRLWIDEDGIVRRAEQKVFMGRGDSFLLRMDLAGRRPLQRQQADRWNKLFDALLDLRRKLDRREDEHRPELDAAQLAKVRSVLEQLETLAEGTPAENLVDSIRRDVSGQERREGRIEGLVKQFVGKPAPDFQLRLIDGRTVSRDDLKGKIVVLHFWNYRHEPLKEPYGQVGYLDFLYHRRHKLGVEIIGVAVQQSLSDPATAGRGRSSVRKLKEFMNLSYPVAVDDGSVLKRFGDPRSFGANLPLYVVVDPEGRIAHYHVGLYRIDPDKGLVELDAVLISLIREARARKTGAGKR